MELTSCIAAPSDLLIGDCQNAVKKIVKLFINLENLPGPHGNEPNEKFRSDVLLRAAFCWVLKNVRYEYLNVNYLKKFYELKFPVKLT